MKLIPLVLSTLLCSTMVNASSYDAYVHPTGTLDHIYYSIIEQDTLSDTVQRCGMVGYRRDRMYDVHRMPDKLQHVHLERNVNRCKCYMDFIDETYANQVAPEALTTTVLKELIASALFIKLESRKHHYYEFNQTPYLSEQAKYSIAFNAKNQCSLDYRP